MSDSMHIRVGDRVEACEGPYLTETGIVLALTEDSHWVRVQLHSTGETVRMWDCNLALLPDHEGGSV